MTKKTTKVEPKKTAAKKKKPQTEAQKKAAQQRAFKKHEKEHRKALLARLRLELKTLPKDAKENRLRRIGQLQEGCGSHEPLVVPKPDTSVVSYGDEVFKRASRDGTLLKILSPSGTFLSYLPTPIYFWLRDKEPGLRRFVGNTVEYISMVLWERKQKKNITRGKIMSGNCSHEWSDPKPIECMCLCSEKCVIRKCLKCNKEQVKFVGDILWKTVIEKGKWCPKDIQ